jgi:flagellar basal-body rod protein FlgF
VSHSIYPTLSGATATWQQVEVIANNLANVNTTGFKQTRVSFDNVMHDMRPLGDSFTNVATNGIDSTDGAIRETGVGTHVALQGEGFLLLEGADGQEYLSRDGNLRLDPERFLVNQRGERVLGVSGPIRVPINEQVEIDTIGHVYSRRNDGTDVMPNLLGRLQLVTADALEARGSSHFAAPNGYQPAVGVHVINGAVEQSNTNPMVAMVDLIQATRYFDVYQKAIQTSDGMDAQINNVARK